MKGACRVGTSGAEEHERTQQQKERGRRDHRKKHEINLSPAGMAQQTGEGGRKTEMERSARGREKKRMQTPKATR